MADHTHRILRNWIKKPTSTSYVTLVSEPISSFFGAGTLVGTSKWVAYGSLKGVLARASTGGDGQTFNFLIHRAPNSASATVVSGGLSNVIGTSTQFILAQMNGTNFEILGKETSDNGLTAILSVTLDLILVGGTGPGS